MWFAFLLVAAIPAAGVLLYLLIRGSLDRLSGWNQLAALYPARQAPAAWNWEHQTIRVGAVRYRRVMRIAVQAERLYLDEAGVPRHPVLYIPWSELRNPAASRLYGQAAVKLEAGPGTIELPVRLYEAIFRVTAPR